MYSFANLVQVTRSGKTVSEQAAAVKRMGIRKY